MTVNLAQKAIDEALQGNWEEALSFNQQLLKEKKNDLDALNRLARAYAELGDFVSARKTSKKVLKIDPSNAIAQKSLLKWKGLKRGETIRSQKAEGGAFIEEPGKTKTINLIHIGGGKTLAKLDPCDEVKLNLHGHRVSVIAQDGKYLGRLPDDIGAKLKKLISMGNEYQIIVKSIQEKEIKVFIKEIKSSPQLSDIPSFTSEKIDYISFTSPELVHQKDTTAAEAD